jgi:hypothetical protein
MLLCVHTPGNTLARHCHGGDLIRDPLVDVPAAHFPRVPGSSSCRTSFFWPRLDIHLTRCSPPFDVEDEPTWQVECLIVFPPPGVKGLFSTESKNALPTMWGWTCCSAAGSCRGRFCSTGLEIFRQLFFKGGPAENLQIGLSSLQALAANKGTDSTPSVSLPWSIYLSLNRTPVWLSDHIYKFLQSGTYFGGRVYS